MDSDWNSSSDTQSSPSDTEKPCALETPNHPKADEKARSTSSRAVVDKEPCLGVTGTPSSVEDSCLEVELSWSVIGKCSLQSKQKVEETEYDGGLQTEDKAENDFLEGFFFTVPYMDLKSLLTLERVSKPMLNEVNNPFVWEKLHVESPLSKALSDDILLSLAKRAKGKLKSLKLVECLRITDAGLARVLALNQALEKLYVPGCTGISAEAIVKMVEKHSEESRAKGVSGIKQLRVRGIYNIRQEELSALRTAISAGDNEKPRPTEPVYWNTDPAHICNDERLIDVEICPRCNDETARIVYDCTKESCQKLGALDPSKACRGCMLCLPRCIGCGICPLRDEEYERTCCADMLCLLCWLRFPKCSQCHDAICRRHLDRLHINFSDESLICENCLYDSYDEGPDLEIIDGVC